MTGKRKIQKAHSEVPIRIHLAMIARSEVFSPPPFGHLGCYASINPFELEVKAGKPVEFYTEAGLAAEGIITCIEQPGSCIRQDMEMFEMWYKLHWIPTNHELLASQVIYFNGVECPQENCGKRSEIIASAQEDGVIVRTRRCPKHKTLKWRTFEIFAGPVRPRGRPRKASTDRRRLK